MKWKSVPTQIQLISALKSMIDPLAADWASSIAPSLQSYEQFKSAFKRNFWSPSNQRIIKCSIYQDKYSRANNLSMSEYFLNSQSLLHILIHG
jgi:hypothetical protein